MKIAPNTPLTVSLAWGEEDVVPVGRLAMRGREIYFQYLPSFVERPLPISPFYLPVSANVIGPFSSLFEGLPGIFNDSLPDGWGRLLMDRRAQKLRVSLSPLDRLAIVGRHGIGALVYQPETRLKGVGGKLDLDELSAEAEAVLEGDPSEILDQLIVLGGSPQGARPKAMIGWSQARNSIVHGAQELAPGYRRFLVKFRAKLDAHDMGPIEYAYSMMAAAAGLRIPSSHLFPSRKGPGFFGVERFDWVGGERRHVHTLSGIINADHRIPSLDYEGILAATSQITRDQREVVAMFRLMVFNVITHNRDDHAKQFSFIMERTGQWSASPAYDLTFAEGPNGWHATTIAGEGLNPKRSDLLTVAKRAGIKENDAKTIIDDVLSAVAGWKGFAKSAGVTKASSKSISDRLLLKI